MVNRSKELTDKEKEEIATMAGLGLRYEDIAKIKGMSDDTLKKYAKEELEKGKAEAKQKVMQTAFTMATSGKYPAMTCFWLKTQASWRESQSVSIDNTNLKELVQNTAKPTQVIIAYLAQTIEEVKIGNITPTMATSIASVAGTFMKAVEQGNLEERLSMLEAMNQTRDTSPLHLEF